MQKAKMHRDWRYNLVCFSSFLLTIDITFSCTFQALTLLTRQVDDWTQWALRHNKQRYKLYMYKDPRLCYKACYIYILLGWGPNVSCSSRGNCYSTGTEGASNPGRWKLSFPCLWLLLPWEWDDALQDTNATVTFFAANRDRFKGIVLDGDVENHVRFESFTKGCSSRHTSP